MKLKISWTYTKWDEPLFHFNVHRHETRAGKHNDNQRTGGMGLRSERCTRYIDRQGRFFALLPEKDEIVLYLEGGLDIDYKYRNTLVFTKAQNDALINEIRSIRHSFPGIEIISEDLRNFDLELWLKTTGLTN
mgnify:CR=1 FL=1